MGRRTDWNFSTVFDDQVNDPQNFGLSDNVISLISAVLSGLTILFLIDLFFRIIVRSSPKRVTSFSIYRRSLFLRSINPLEALFSIFRKRRTITERPTADLPGTTVENLVQVPSRKKSANASPNHPYGSHVQQMLDDDVESQTLHQHTTCAVPHSEINDRNGFPTFQTLVIIVAGILLIILELLLIFTATNRTSAVPFDKTKIPSFRIRDPGQKVRIFPEWNPCRINPLVSKRGFSSQATFLICSYVIKSEFRNVATASGGNTSISSSNTMQTTRFWQENYNKDNRVQKRNETSTFERGFGYPALSSMSPSNIQTKISQTMSDANCSNPLEIALVFVNLHRGSLQFTVKMVGYETISQHFTRIALQNSTAYQTVVRFPAEEIIEVFPKVLSRHNISSCMAQAVSLPKEGEWFTVFRLDYSKATLPADITASLGPANETTSNKHRNTPLLRKKWAEHLDSIFRGSIYIDGRDRAYRFGWDPDNGPFLEDVEDALITLQRPWLSIVGGLAFFSGVLLFWSFVAFVLGWGAGEDERIAWMYVFRSMNSMTDFKRKQNEILYFS